MRPEPPFEPLPDLAVVDIVAAVRTVVPAATRAARRPLRVGLVAAIALAGLAVAAPVQGAALRVMATTVQIAALTRAVAGGEVEVRGLIPPGADPHEFEPTASDLVAVEKADLILRHGLGLDEWLDRALRAGKRASVVTVTTGLQLRQEEVRGRMVTDPHVWHDPVNARRMVDNIAAALGARDPRHGTDYGARAEQYGKTLDEAAAQVRAILAEIPPARRKLVTNHDDLGYFAWAYGFRIVGTIIPSVSTQAEPSAGEVAALLRAIRRENVKVIFAETGANPKLATTLAREAGVRIVSDLYGDSLGRPGSGADTLEGMWLSNARKIAEALR